MESYTFDNYDEYVHAQRRTTLHKTNRPQGYRPFVGHRAVRTIAKHYGKPPHHGLCHGVRGGEELDLFEQIVGGDWVGTEIVEELCDGMRIIHHDFEQPRLDWRGRFDIVYSNSLDHARSPETAVSEWLRQLSDVGVLYIEWTKFSSRLGKGWNRADCWAATRVEYADLISVCGGVIDAVLESRGKSIFVVRDLPCPDKP